MTLKNPKAKGSRLEREYRHKLEADGWWVIRAGGSLGLFDLVALSKTKIRLISVKPNIMPEDVLPIENFDNAPDGTEIYLITHGTGEFVENLIKVIGQPYEKYSDKLRREIYGSPSTTQANK